MTESSTPNLVNDPFVPDTASLSSLVENDMWGEWAGTNKASTEPVVSDKMHAWKPRGSSPSPPKLDRYDCTGHMTKEEENRVLEQERRAHLEQELERRQCEVEAMKVSQALAEAGIDDIRQELGHRKPRKLAEASVLGIPIQQFTKATFNDASLIPSKFVGKRQGIDSLNRWIEQFNKYTKFKQMDDNTKLEFFKLLMVDEAADWAASLEGAEEISDFEDLFERFRERFLLTDIQKWQQARSVWQRQQKPNESVDEYITWVKNRAKNLPEIGEHQLAYIVISGLRKEIRADVLKAKHDTLDEIKKIARISEIAERESSDGNTTIADLEKTIAMLVDRVDQKLVNSPDTTQCNHSHEQPAAYSAMGNLRIERTENRQLMRRAQPPRSDSRQQFANRNPLPVRRMPWQQSAQNNSRPNSQFRQQSPYRQPQQSAQNRPSFDSRPNYRAAQPQQPYRGNNPNSDRNCGNCGLQHERGQCPAFGSECYHCKKRGHYARACRSARNPAGSQ
jgi:Retrotransposon gag protein